MDVMYGAESISEDELDYYSRQIVLNDLGVDGQLKLKSSRVCVIGVGGLGSPVCMQLASMGVGFIRIVDRDVVDISNLQRQHLYGVDDIGIPKVEAAKKRLVKMNPFIEVEPVPVSITYHNAESILEGCDVVVDCLDNMSARYTLNRTCLKLGIPLVYGAVIMKVGNTTTIIPGETACLECFQGGVNDASLPSCATAGVYPSIINIIASIQVSETVKLINEKEPVLAGKLLFVDLEDLSFERIGLSRVESCPICGESPVDTTLELDEIEEICGREESRVFIFTPISTMDVDLTGLNSVLEKEGYSINVRAELGTSFSKGDLKFSVLKTGVMILEGLNSRKMVEDYISKFEDLILIG